MPGFFDRLFSKTPAATTAVAVSVVPASSATAKKDDAPKTQPPARPHTPTVTEVVAKWKKLELKQTISTFTPPAEAPADATPFNAEAEAEKHITKMVIYVKDPNLDFSKAENETVALIESLKNEAATKKNYYSGEAVTRRAAKKNSKHDNDYYITLKGQLQTRKELLQSKQQQNKDLFDVETRGFDTRRNQLIAEYLTLCRAPETNAQHVFEIAHKKAQARLNEARKIKANESATAEEKQAASSKSFTSMSLYHPKRREPS